MKTIQIASAPKTHRYEDDSLPKMPPDSIGKEDNGSIRLRFLYSFSNIFQLVSLFRFHAEDGAAT